MAKKITFDYLKIGFNIPKLKQSLLIYQGIVTIKTEFYKKVSNFSFTQVFGVYDGRNSTFPLLMYEK